MTHDNLPSGGSENSHSLEAQPTFNNLRSFLKVAAQIYQKGEWTPDHIVPVQHALLSNNEQVPTQENALTLPSANTPQDIMTRNLLETGATDILDIAATILAWTRIADVEEIPSDRITEEYYDIPDTLVQLARGGTLDDNTFALLKSFIHLETQHRETISQIHGTIIPKDFDDVLQTVLTIVEGLWNIDTHTNVPVRDTLLNAIATAFRSLDGDIDTDSQDFGATPPPHSPMSGGPEGAIPPQRPSGDRQGAKVPAGGSRR